MLPGPPPQPAGPAPSRSAHLPGLRLIGRRKPEAPATAPIETGRGVVARTSAELAPTLAELVDRVIHPPTGGLRARGTALVALVPVLTASARASGTRAVVAGRWLADVVADLAPHIVVRDAAELRRQFPRLTDDEIAAHLVTVASRTTAAIGAAAGAVAAAEFAAPPALLAAPVQLAAETVAVVAVEVRMVAELHEINNLGVRGGPRVAGPAYLNSWVRRRAATGVEGFGLAGLLGDAAKRELRVRILRRVGRSTTSLAPFLAGAAAGAEVNRRSTKDLGERLRAEMRGLRGRAEIVVPQPGDIVDP